MAGASNDDRGAIGADDVAPGIERLALRTPTLPPATHTNAYLVGSGEAILVEPASPYDEEIRRAVRWAQDARDRGRRLLGIVATHHHADHVGGATALARALSLPLWAHAETAARLDGRVRFDRLLEHGETLELAGDPPATVDVVLTPGHAPGHLCLLDRGSGALLCGDMVASVGTILVEPEDGDMALYLRSLAAMKALRPRTLLPAHGDPIDDPDALLDRYVAHRLARERKVLEALEARVEPATAAELVPRAYDDAPPTVWPLAALSTEAHLRKLVDDGRARRAPGGRYLPVSGPAPGAP